MSLAEARSGAARTPARVRPRAASLLAAMVGLAALAYLLPFRLYGFDVVDEGTLLEQIDRAAHGERPYLDFETGYTPGYFAVESALWRATGSDVVASRTLGVALHAATAGLLFAVLRAHAGVLIALAATAVHIAYFLPVSLRFGAPFNVPYPGWLAALLALAAQAVVAWAAATRPTPGGRDDGAGRRRVALAAAGACAGAIFSVKPNSGLLALGGVALAAAAGFAEGAGAARALAAAIALAALGATLALALPGADAATALVLVAPVALAAVRIAAARRADAHRGGERPGEAGASAPAAWDALLELAALGVGFALPVLPWLVPLAARLGLDRLRSDVLLLDGSVVRAFTIPIPPPGTATLALGAALVACALLVRVANQANRVVGELAALAVPWVLAAGLGAAALLVGEGGARLAAENACLWIPPLGLAVGLAGAPRRERYRGEWALACFAAVYHLQIFPRIDLIHAAMSSPPMLVAAGASWARIARRWRTALRGAAPRARGRAPVVLRLTPVACAAVVLALAAGRAVPTFAARFAEPMAPLDAGPRAPLTVDARYAADFSWLGETVRAVEAHSAADAPLFTFPDLAAIAFLARRPAPFRYLYFVPQRPDHAGEGETIARLDALRPPLAVTGEPRVPAFHGATDYFSGIAAYLAEHYCPLVDTAQSRVLARRPEGGGAAPCRALAAPGAG